MSYALGTVMLLFVAYNLNQFAKRSTSAGSMYAYICRGLSVTAGAVGGWSLIWAYLGISMAGVTGFPFLRASSSRWPVSTSQSSRCSGAASWLGGTAHGKMC